MTLEQEFYTPKELAEILKVDVMTIYRYVKRGELIAYKIGRNQRFRRQDVEEFLKKRKQKPQLEE